MFRAGKKKKVMGETLQGGVTSNGKVRPLHCKGFRLIKQGHAYIFFLKRGSCTIMVITFV